MAKIIISENVSVDGVIRDPVGAEGASFGGWFGQISDADREAWAAVEADEAGSAAALLLGRKTYEFFAARWPARSGEWADRLNALPKYVISATLGNAAWTNSTVLSGDVVNEVSKLKQRLSGDIVVYASGQLVPALMAHDLVDELRLMIYPCLLGSSERLFGESGRSRPMRLAVNQTVGDNLALLTYRPA